MKRRIDKVAVLGAERWVPGLRRIWQMQESPAFVLEMVPPEPTPGDNAAVRNKIVIAGLEAAKKAKPAAFFTARFAGSRGNWKFR